MQGSIYQYLVEKLSLAGFTFLPVDGTEDQCHRWGLLGQADPYNKYTVVQFVYNKDSDGSNE